MKIEFVIPGDPPRVTAQQKGQNRKTGAYYKPLTLRHAEERYWAAAVQHRPEEPLTGPLAVTLEYYFETSEAKKRYQYKTTRPDADNMAKVLLDSMTRAGFWRDDAQVADLEIVKYWGPVGQIRVMVEELP